MLEATPRKPSWERPPIRKVFCTKCDNCLEKRRISTYYYKKSERKRIKVDTAKRLFSNRFDVTGDEFSRALNEVFVIFYDSKVVMKSLAEFHQIIVSKQKHIANDKLVKLFKAICEDTGIDYRAFNDSFFLQPFNIKPESMALPQPSADR
jgi:hypothetical protein